MNKTSSIYLALAILITASLACTFPFQAQVLRGSGNIIEEDRDVSGFNKTQFQPVGLT